MTEVEKTGTAKKIEVMQAYEAGSTIETRDYLSGWVEMDRAPVWNWHSTEYRVKPTTLDIVPWTVIDPSFRWSARDEAGTIYIYQEEPEIGYASASVWHSTKGDSFLITGRISVTAGDENWRESLQQRPE